MLSASLPDSSEVLWSVACLGLSLKSPPRSCMWLIFVKWLVATTHLYLVDILLTCDMHKHVERITPDVKVDTKKQKQKLPCPAS